jgi:hypothetical protein
MSVTLEQAKKVLDKYTEETTKFLKEYKLSELPAYSELQTKETLVEHYREDQYYFEKVSNFKANFYGIKNFFLKFKAENTDRVTTREVDAIEGIINEKIKHLDVVSSTAKQRINFYDRIIYLISNMSFGDY